jgi:hypothetical protein
MDNRINYRTDDRADDRADDRIDNWMDAHLSRCLKNWVAAELLTARNAPGFLINPRNQLLCRAAASVCERGAALHSTNEEPARLLLLGDDFVRGFAMRCLLKVWRKARVRQNDKGRCLGPFTELCTWILHLADEANLIA